jgi:uncharacterized membrane protein YbhN (UPF0104 family)
VRSSQFYLGNRPAHAAFAGLTIALFALVFWRNQATIADVLGGPVDVRLVALALVITQISLVVTFVRWWILARVFAPDFPLRSAMVLGFIGYAFNLLIPGAVGGDVVKIAFLARMGIRKTPMIVSMVADRLLGLTGLLLLAAAAGALTGASGPPGVRLVIVATWGMLGLGAGAAALFWANTGRLFAVRGLPRQAWASRLRIRLIAAARCYGRRPPILLAGLGLSLASQAMSVLVFFLIGKALFGAQVTASLEQHFLMVPLTFLTMVLPLPWGALGLTEEVGGQLFKMVEQPGGAVVMMGLRLVMLVCALPGACLYLANPGVAAPVKCDGSNKRPRATRLPGVRPKLAEQCGGAARGSKPAEVGGNHADALA